MIKKTKPISINILSVFTILVSLLLSCVGITNAWFTSEKQNGVKIIVSVGAFQLNLYQDIDGEDTKILTNKDNETSTSPQYVDIGDKILPDTPIELDLTLINEDSGSAAMYVRYKFEVYARGVNSDMLIPCTIAGFTQQTETQVGFDLDESNGYYYYKDTDGTNKLFTKGTSQTLMTTFTIPYSSFINSNGSLKLINSDTIHIKVIIDASSSQTFSS